MWHTGCTLLSMLRPAETAMMALTAQHRICIFTCLLGLSQQQLTFPLVFLQLFEFLGPEGLEMISTLLQHRTAIVSSLLAAPADRPSYPSGGMFLSSHTHYILQLFINLPAYVRQIAATLCSKIVTLVILRSLKELKGVQPDTNKVFLTKREIALNYLDPLQGYYDKLCSCLDQIPNCSFGTLCSESPLLPLP